MGKSLRTSLTSYTSLYLRRSRTGRGFEPPDRTSPRGLPCRVQSRPAVVPIPARAKSKSRPVASGMLSETTRHHPTSMPRSDPVVSMSTGPATIDPSFMPLSTEVSRRPPRALVGPQLHYLTVHLVEGLAEPGLQPCPPVIGEVSGHSPRFFEKHAHVLQLRYLGLRHLPIS